MRLVERSLPIRALRMGDSNFSESAASIYMQQHAIDHCNPQAAIGRRSEVLCEEPVRILRILKDTRLNVSYATIRTKITKIACAKKPDFASDADQFLAVGVYLKGLRGAVYRSATDDSRSGIPKSSVFSSNDVLRRVEGYR